MRHALIIAWLDLLIFLRSRSNLLQMTLVPVVLTLVLGYALGGGGNNRPQALRLDVLDQDGSPRSRQLVGALVAQGPALQVCPAASVDCVWDAADAADLERAIERVRSGAAAALLQIPAGFGVQSEAQQPATLPFFTTAAVPAADPAWQGLQVALTSVNGVAAADVTARAMHQALGLNEAEREAYLQATRELAGDAWSTRPMSVVATASDNRVASTVPTGFAQSVPGMASFYVLFGVMGGGMAVIIRERREGTLARMATLPLRRSEIIAGKILARFVTGMLQFLIIFAVGVAVGLDFGAAPLALILLMASYTLVITALGIALAGLIRSDEQASLLTALIAMIMAALGGAWWPLSLAPPFMQVIGHLTPVAWVMKGIQHVVLRGGTLEDVLAPLAVLSAFSVVLFVLGLRLFRFR